MTREGASIKCDVLDFNKTENDTSDYIFQCLVVISFRLAHFKGRVEQLSGVSVGKRVKQSIFTTQNDCMRVYG